jgi:hypothetical protein
VWPIAAGGDGQDYDEVKLSRGESSSRAACALTEFSDKSLRVLTMYGTHEELEVAAAPVPTVGIVVMRIRLQVAMVRALEWV